MFFWVFVQILFRIRSDGFSLCFYVQIFGIKYVNQSQWGTRLIQKGKFPRIDQVDSEKQKARNSQTFALKSLSLQIPLVLQLQSLRTRFWKIHCGILWKRIMWTFVEVEFLVRISSRGNTSYTCLLEFHRWYLVDTVIFMRRNCNDYDWTYWTCKTSSQGTNISCGMQFLRQIWRRNAKSSNWSGSLGSRPARGIHRNPGRNPGRAMMLEHDGQS